MAKQPVEVSFKNEVIYRGRRANYNQPYKDAVFIEEAMREDGKENVGRILIFETASPFLRVDDIPEQEGEN